ncbi:phage Gp37/Gp68 family protein [Burkholderia stabilis]|uniref:phage Gp37/Gp68 family protein n=1 Tax=Burkholderia stabilis TaxID=95485 RepID=UPI001589A76F|nr:phage Gp37/Gp68 family protein [Burkholderia stabilis]
MSENTSIEWCDHTFNPWEGCQKVGPGCDHCYAETRNARFAGGTAVNWGAGAPRRRTSPANWRKPLQWNRDGTFYATHGRRQRVFCASLADVFDNEVDLLWRRDLFRLIDDTQNLDWLLLTKRIGNVPTMLRHIGVEKLPDNVWLGATIVNQAEADRDIPKLLEVPARVRFLSMEPLLGPVDLLATGDVLCRCGGCLEMAATYPEQARLQRIDWVIAGGESGPGARPMHPDWARSLRDQCAAAGAAFLFKQWGEWLPAETDVDSYAVANDGSDRELSGRLRLTTIGSQQLLRVGKSAAGRLLDGRTHDEFPEAR